MLSIKYSLFYVTVIIYFSLKWKNPEEQGSFLFFRSLWIFYDSRSALLDPANQDLLRWVFIGLFALMIPRICLITPWYRSSFYRQRGNLQ